jgi:hypothetical protein
MAVHNIEIATENLLGLVVRMPEREFDRFLKHARKIKNREEKLIEKLNKFSLLPDDEKLYRKLSQKMRAEKITSEEHKTLIKFSDKLEEMNVERLECLLEIAKIRQEPIEKVMKDLNIKPQNYD